MNNYQISQHLYNLQREKIYYHQYPKSTKFFIDDFLNSNSNNTIRDIKILYHNYFMQLIFSKT